MSIKRLEKRNKEFNALMKEHKYQKDDIDEITSRFGSLDDIKDRFEVARMKEEKVNDLLNQLDSNLKS